MSLKNITVFCGSSNGNNELFEKAAFQLGQYLAQNNLTLVYGAAKIGIMGAVAKACLNNGGKVIGVIPEFLTDKEVLHTELSELYVLDTMHQRKQKMNELADAFIVLPGGFGTMEEFFEVLTWGQLGLHQKPIAILNVDGFYDSLIEFINQMVNSELLKPVNRDMILVSDEISKLFQLIHNYSPPEVPKWLKTDSLT